MRVFISEIFKKKYNKIISSNFSMQYFVNKLIDSNQIKTILKIKNKNLKYSFKVSL